MIISDRALDIAPLQTSLWGSGSTEPITELGPFEHLDDSSSILHAPGWLGGSDELFGYLIDDLAWCSTERPMYGRVVAVPRLIATVSIADLAPGHPLVALRDQLGEALARDFTRIGANLYRDGADSVAWHRDKVGRNPASAIVALVSLGSPRTLRMRPIGRVGSHRTRAWQLGGGDLFVMGGACQLRWEHSVSKVRSAGPRISLAFRSTNP